MKQSLITNANANIAPYAIKVAQFLYVIMDKVASKTAKITAASFL